MNARLSASRRCEIRMAMNSLLSALPAVRPDENGKFRLGWTGQSHPKRGPVVGRVRRFNRAGMALGWQPGR